MDKLNETSLELTIDFLEVGMDIITDNELLKEIPILGSLVKIAIIKNSISEKLLLKKLSIFFNEFERQSEKNKQKLLQNLKTPEDKQKIGENLLLLIDKFDAFEKPQLLAKIFASFLSNNISQSEFLRMGRGINIAFIADLNTLITVNLESIDREMLENLLPTGFSKIMPQAAGIENFAFIRIGISDLGKKFIRILQKN